MEQSSKSVKNNYIYNLAYQMLLLIMPIITTPYLSRTLGSEGIGIYSYTISTVTYFVLFGTLGMAMYAQREIAYYQDNKEKISKIFWQLMTIRITAMLLVGLIFYFVFCINGEYSVCYKILLLEILATIFDISWFFQGMEDFKKIATRNFVIKIFSVILVFCFIKNNGDTPRYLFIYCFTNLLGNLSLWFKIGNYISFVKINIKEVVSHIVPIFSLFIPQIAIQIYTLFDKTMIGKMTNDMSQVGYYEQAQKIIKIVLTIVTAIGIVMVPRISNLYKNKKKIEINQYIQKTFRFIWFLATPLMFGIMSISNNFVPVFFGEGFEQVKLLMMVLSPIILAIGFSNLIGLQYLVPVGKESVLTVSVTVGALTNLVFNFIFIKYLGALGACISTVIAEFSVLICQAYYIRRNNDFDVSCLYRSAIVYIASGILMFGIVYYMGFLLNPSWCTLGLQVIVGIAIYFGTLFIFKDAFFINYFKLYYNKIFKK